MLTDRRHMSTRYLTRRLLTDVIKNDEAARGRRLTLGTRVWLSPVPVDIGGTESDRTSMQAFARRAVDLVSDHTTDLDAYPAGLDVMDRVTPRFGVRKTSVSRSPQLRCEVGAFRNQSEAWTRFVLYGLTPTAEASVGSSALVRPASSRAACADKCAEPIDCPFAIAA